DRIFAVKGRPRGHPLIVHLGAPSWLDDWAIAVPDAARGLAAAFWPGPLTLLVARNPRIPDVTTGGRPTVGLRVPAHPVAAGLLASHYAPRATVGLAADAATAAARAQAERRAGRAVDVLAPDVSAEDYARHLYAWLREADARALDVLVVVPPPDTGIGAAVNERLRKAASPRSDAGSRP